MKSIIPALLIFILLTFMTACSKSKIQVDDKPQEISNTSYHTAVTTHIHTKKQTSHVQTTASQSQEVTQTSVLESQPPDDKNIEESLLGEISDVDYDAGAAIPYVAWTEINLDKIMYTQLPCAGFEFALPDAHEKMKYDAGVAVHVIARTDTNYYRIEGDVYIPCDYLDNEIPDGIDASQATSCTVYIPPVTTAATTTTPHTTPVPHQSSESTS